MTLVTQSGGQVMGNSYHVVLLSSAYFGVGLRAEFSAYCMLVNLLIFHGVHVLCPNRGPCPAPIVVVGRYTHSLYTSPSVISPRGAFSHADPPCRFVPYRRQDACRAGRLPVVLRAPPRRPVVRVDGHPLAVERIG